MKYFIKKISIIICILGFVALPYFSYAQTPINLDGPSLLPKAELFTTPHTGDFLVDSTFEVPIYVNTGGFSINTISVKLKFNPDRLSIIKPSGGRSIFGIWLEPPSYDNINGTASFVGVIPNGIVTSSGLIATITFKAISAGEAHVDITDYSSANLNDGIGSNVKLSLNGSFFSINPKTPDGVAIYSDTHPFQERWYNNNSPVFRWDSPKGVKGYNVIFDFNPNTIPPTTITTNNSSISYENLKDGVWYLHVRANINGVWGNVSHYQIRIDTNSPAYFSSAVNTLKDNTGTNKYLVSFVTTDSLSGIDHYEVGLVDDNSENISSPMFVQTESPYLVPSTSKSMHVIIRAFDGAGNIRESSIDLYPGVNIMIAMKRYALYLFIFLTFLLLLELLLHYLFGHHIIDHIKKMFLIFKKISSNEEKYKKIEEKLVEIADSKDISAIDSNNPADILIKTNNIISPLVFDKNIENKDKKEATVIPVPVEIPKTEEKENISMIAPMPIPIEAPKIEENKSENIPAPKPAENTQINDTNGYLDNFVYKNTLNTRNETNKTVEQTIPNGQNNQENLQK